MNYIRGENREKQEKKKSISDLRYGRARRMPAALTRRVRTTDGEGRKQNPHTNFEYEF